MPLRSSDVGQQFTKVLSRSEFNTVRNLFGDRSRVAIGRAPDNTVSIQMNIPKGENRTSTFFLDPLGNPGVDAACLSLRIFFQNGFEWAHGGGGTKLGFGLWGGDQASNLSGGTRPNDQEGWSVRNVNNQYGFRLYSYHLNRPSRFGQQGTPLARWGSGDWRPGQWHDVDLEIVMNDLGKSNGYAQLWLNGKYRQTMTNLRFRNNSSWAIRGLYFSDVWGGRTSDPNNFSPKAQRMWYTDFKLLTQSGGAVSQRSTSSSPSSPQSTSSNQSTSASASGAGSSFGAVAPTGTIGGSNVTVQWTPDSSADKYYVQVLTDRDRWSDRQVRFVGSAFPGRHCNGSVCSLDVGNLARDAYEWRVRPQYGSRNGNYDTLAFRVGDAAAAAPAPTSVNDSSVPTSSDSTSASASGAGSSFGAVAPTGTIGSSNVTVQWTPDPNADKYYVQVLTDRDRWSDRQVRFVGSAFPGRHCNGSVCSLDVGNLARDAYEWRVRPQYGSRNGDYDTAGFAIR